MQEPAQAPRQLKGKPLGGSIAAGEVPTLAQLGLQPVSRIPGTSHARGGADICKSVWSHVSFIEPVTGPRSMLGGVGTVSALAPSKLYLPGRGFSSLLGSGCVMMAPTAPCKIAIVPKIPMTEC